MTATSEMHTQGELKVVASDTLFTMVSEDGVQVAKTSWHGSIRKPYPLREEARANAARIVLTWNCHDDLVAALRKARPYVGMVRSSDIDDRDPIFGVMDEIDAALSRATSPTP